MFVMAFIVETIRIFCDGSIVFFFSAGLVNALTLTNSEKYICYSIYSSLLMLVNKCLWLVHVSSFVK